MIIDVPEMLSIQAAAEKANLPYELIRRLCHQGKIKYVKSGVKFWVNFESLCEYLRTGDQNDEHGNDSMLEKK